SGRDTEMALSRLARLTERIAGNGEQAAAIYEEQLRLFPNGSLALDARSALGRLGTPTLVFSAGQQNGVSAPAVVTAAATEAVPIPQVSALLSPAGGAVVPGLDTEPTSPPYRAHYVNSTSGLSLSPLGGDGSREPQ
ncbi:MAG: hypothetical protein V4671_12465, partial [Armatimonadota bacterium]